MKKLIALFLFAGILTSALAQKEEVRILKSFESIHAYKGINVILESGDSSMVKIMIENGELEDVLTDVESHTLKIRMQTKIYKDVAVTAIVTYTKLNEIVAGTGAEVTSDEILYSNKLELICNTGSSIQLRVESRSLDLNASEGSSMEISGSTEILNAKANGGSNVDASQLNSEDAWAKASSGAEIDINVTENLDANASLGGSINFSGNPKKTEFKTTLGGNINESQNQLEDTIF